MANVTDCQTTGTFHFFHIRKTSLFRLKVKSFAVLVIIMLWTSLSAAYSLKFTDYAKVELLNNKARIDLESGYIFDVKLSTGKATKDSVVFMRIATCPQCLGPYFIIPNVVKKDEIVEAKVTIPFAETIQPGSYQLSLGWSEKRDTILDIVLPEVDADDYIRLDKSALTCSAQVNFYVGKIGVQKLYREKGTFEIVAATIGKNNCLKNITPRVIDNKVSSFQLQVNSSDIDTFIGKQLTLVIRGGKYTFPPKNIDLNFEKKEWYREITDDFLNRGYVIFLLLLFILIAITITIIIHVNRKKTGTYPVTLKYVPPSVKGEVITKPAITQKGIAKAIKFPDPIDEAFKRYQYYFKTQERHESFNEVEKRKEFLALMKVSDDITVLGATIHNLDVDYVKNKDVPFDLEFNVGGSEFIFLSKRDRDQTNEAFLLPIPWKEYSNDIAKKILNFFYETTGDGKYIIEISKGCRIARNLWGQCILKPPEGELTLGDTLDTSRSIIEVIKSDHPEEVKPSLLSPTGASVQTDSKSKEKVLGTYTADIINTIQTEYSNVVTKLDIIIPKLEKIESDLFTSQDGKNRPTSERDSTQLENSLITMEKKLNEVSLEIENRTMKSQIDVLNLLIEEVKVILKSKQRAKLEEPSIDLKEFSQDIKLLREDIQRQGMMIENIIVSIKNLCDKVDLLL
jgi:hypothetical protein